MNESHFFFFLLYVADMHNCKIEKKLRVMCRPKVRGVEKANSARLEVLAGVKVWFQFFKFWEITLNFLLDQGGDCWHNWVHPQHLGQQAKERSQSFNCRPSHRYPSEVKVFYQTSPKSDMFCQFCNKNYMKWRTLKTHLKKMHGRELILTCEKCNTTF